jgi:putative PIN family toxin of toxin-antitoxin system
MRAVLDTNILCSALLTPGGLTDRLYHAWREGRFELLTSEEQLEEFRRVTRYPHLRPFIEPAAAGAMHNELRRLAVLVGKLPAVDASRDPGDNFMLPIAQAGEADVLVTGDKHDLLSLKKFERTRIVTARQFLDSSARKRSAYRRDHPAPRVAESARRPGRGGREPNGIHIQ